MDNLCSAIHRCEDLFVSNKPVCVWNLQAVWQACMHARDNAILMASTVCRMNIKQTERILFSYGSTFRAVPLTQRGLSVSHVGVAPRNIATFTSRLYCLENRSLVVTNQMDIDTKYLFSLVAFICINGARIYWMRDVFRTVNLTYVIYWQEYTNKKKQLWSDVLEVLSQRPSACFNLTSFISPCVRGKKKTSFSSTNWNIKIWFKSRI